MRLAKFVILWAVAIFMPLAASHAADRSHQSVAEFLESLNAVAAPDLGEGGVPPMIQLTCTSTVSCGTYPPVTCTASTGTCGAGVNQNCPTRGYAECNGVRTYCPSCRTKICFDEPACIAHCGVGAYECVGDSCLCT